MSLVGSFFKERMLTLIRLGFMRVVFSGEGRGRGGQFEEDFNISRRT